MNSLKISFANEFAYIHIYIYKLNAQIGHIILDLILVQDILEVLNWSYMSVTCFILVMMSSFVNFVLLNNDVAV